MASNPTPYPKRDSESFTDPNEFTRLNSADEISGTRTPTSNVAGALAMTHGNVQDQYSVKEPLPRLLLRLTLVHFTIPIVGAYRRSIDSDKMTVSWWRHG